MTDIRVRLCGFRIRRCDTAAYVPQEHKRAILPEELPAGVVPVKYFEFGHEKLLSIRRSAEEISVLERIAADLKLDPRECIRPTKVEVYNLEYELVIKESHVPKLPSKYRDEIKGMPPPSCGFYETPVLYRFLPRKYAQRLFSLGELLISSFERCRKHEGGCGDRYDKDEGKGMFAIQSGDCVAEFDIQVGGNPLMLCSSLNVNAKHNKEDVCIEIFDLPGMINEITKELRAKGVRIKRIQHGPCNYANRLFVRKCAKVGSALMQLLNGLIGNGFDYEMCARMPLMEIGNKHYFTKPVNFANEHEYRIVWDCENVPAVGSVIVTLRDPSAYCRYAS